MSTINSFC